MANFKNVGTWWNNRDIDLVEIEGAVYALHGWNGETYLHSWKCSGEFNTDASEEEYAITPIFKQIEEDEFEVVGYEVR